MGRPLFTITSGNSWIIQWTPVDYVVSKTLGPPLGEEDRKQKGIKTRLKVKEFNRSGPIPLWSLRSRGQCFYKLSAEGSRITQAQQWAADVQLSYNIQKWRRPCLPATMAQRWQPFCCSSRVGHMASALEIPICFWKETHTLPWEAPHP